MSERELNEIHAQLVRMTAEIMRLRQAAEAAVKVLAQRK